MKSEQVLIFQIVHSEIGADEVAGGQSAGLKRVIN
jgi:hypothetical protein